MSNFWEIFKKRQDTKQLALMQDIQESLNLFCMTLCMYSTEYENLPEEIPNWIMEEYLYTHGNYVFLEQDGVYCVCSSSAIQELNIYGLPNKVTPISRNGSPFAPRNISSFAINNGGKTRVEKQNAVLARNNYWAIPTQVLIYPYINRLCFLWQSLGINASMARIKSIIRGNKDSAKTLDRVFQQTFGSRKPFIVVNEYMNDSQVDKLDFEYANQQKDLWDDFDKTFNLMLNICGINSNSQSDKKERLLVDEVNSNNELVSIMKSSRTSMRKEAIKQINKIFSLDIRVKECYNNYKEDKMNQNDISPYDKSSDDV